MAKKICMECQKKEGRTDFNYAGFDIKKNRSHFFPGRIKDLILPGNKSREFLCANCANKIRVECRVHGIIHDDNFALGKPPKCKKCDEIYFPPRADCLKCMDDKFEWIEFSGKGTLNSFTTIHTAPKGFDDIAPYTIGIVDLKEGGRLLAWIGDIPKDKIKNDMPVKVVP